MEFGLISLVEFGLISLVEFRLISLVEFGLIIVQNLNIILSVHWGIIDGGRVCHIKPALYSMTCRRVKWMPMGGHGWDHVYSTRDTALVGHTPQGKLVG